MTVGAFVLGLSVVFISGILWLASGGAFQKKYDTYLAVENESVAGLNLNAPVKFNGVDVGKVREITLDPADPGRVRLLFSIERGTPLKEDTVAVLKTQGLTGIAYVELSGGGRDAAPLRATAQNPYPEIRTKASLAARLENVMTSVLEKLDRTSSHIDALLSDKNQLAFSNTLADIAAVSHTLAARKETLDQGILSAARAFDNGARVSAQLGPAINQMSRSARALEIMGSDVSAASIHAGVTLESVGVEVKQMSAHTLPELQRLMGELQTLSISLRRVSEQTELDPRSLLLGRSALREGPGETALRTPRHEP